MFANR